MTTKALLRSVICMLLAVFVTGSFSLYETTYAVSKPSKVKTLSVQVKSYSTASISWSKTSKASGYQVIRNGAEVCKTKSRSFANYNLAGSHGYTYKVRAYKTYKKTQYFNKKSRKWQTKKPKKKYRGGKRKVTMYKYGSYSPARTIWTPVASVKPETPTTQEPNDTVSLDHEWRLATTAEKQEEVTIYRCTCGFKSFTKEDMVTHIENSKDYTSVTTQVKPYKCNSCEATFDTARQAELHTLLNIYEPGDFVNYIEETGKFKCNICGEEYSSQETCVAHMESAHAPCPNGATRVEQLQSTTITTYTCENCGFTCSALEEINEHLDAQGHRHSYRTTTDAWIAPHWVCEDCGKRSMQEQHVHNWVQKYDTVTHTEDIKIYGFEFCPKCGYCYDEAGWWDEKKHISYCNTGKVVYERTDANHWTHGDECGVGNWLNRTRYLRTQKVTWTEKTNLHYECETCGKTK